MHDGRTNLSKLIYAAVKAGEPFVIAKAGLPVVTATPIAPPLKLSRKGFMQGQFTGPGDFDTMLQDDLVELFDRDA